MTVHVPVPFIIVKVSPMLRQAPPFENVTRPPAPLAATLNSVPYTAVEGACVVMVIVWFAFCAVTDSINSGAAL
ncbi:MAG: hypothetical protein E6G16_06805 [Actinobacteria bacterium]|nr:MAG: hypothetical protein E6G16_06805 [Actinomycetota bacterium]